MPSSMRCFKSFFKHTWHPQQMDTPSRFETSKSELQCDGDTELGEVKMIVATSSVSTSTPAQSSSIPCRNGGCKPTRTRTEPRPESPWHVLKTVFLISMVVALIVWVIAYALLAQYRIL